MAKFWKLKTLLVKVEATEGVDAAPTGVANAILAFNLSLKPMQGQDVKRKREVPYFTAAENITTGEYAEITFDVELIGATGLGTAPGWSPVAKACRLAETLSAGVSVTYNPISTAIPSATIHLYIDGVKHAYVGCRGKAQVVLNAHNIPMLRVTMWGVFAIPTDVANPAPTLTSFQTPQVVNKGNTPTFTINGVAVKARSYTLDDGNQMVYRDLIGGQNVLITDGEPMLSAQIEAVAMSSINPFSLAKNSTPFAVSIVHGVGAGKITTISAPSCRMMRMDDYANTDNIWEWPLKMTPLPSSGNDDYTIVLT